MNAHPDPAPAAAPEPGPNPAWFDIGRDPAGWDRAAGAAGAGIFHLSGMLAAHRYGRAVPRGVLIARDGRTVGALGGLFTAGRRFATLGFVPHGPGLPEDLPLRLGRWLAGQGAPEVEFGSFDGGVEDFAPIPGARLTERLEFPWAMDTPPEARAKALNSNHRRKLSKLAPMGVELREVRHRTAAVLTRVQRHWEARKGEGGGLSGWLRLHGFHRRLERHVGRPGLATLYGLYRGPTLLSAAYMLEHGERAFYMLGASSPDGYRIGASVGLFMALAERYAGRGVRVLNLGGVPKAAEKDGHDEHGVYRFKVAFGIQPVARRTMAWRPDGGET